MEILTTFNNYLKNNITLQKISAKVFIRVDKTKYLFSIKKVLNNTLKNRKLELLGGCFDQDKDRDTFDTLTRELKEEEVSEYLYKKARKHTKKLETIVIQGKKGLQLYKMYLLDINSNEYNLIKNHYFDIESFGFVLLERKNVEDSEWFFNNINMFTPKTAILLSSMLITNRSFTSNF